MSIKRSTRWFSLLLAGSLSFAGTLHSAQAAMIGTAELAPPTAAAAVQRSGTEARAMLAAQLDRADLAAALQARGVDPAQVRARVDALSDTEAQWLAQQVDEAPAGASDLLGALLFIFVLLLVTDILGLTKVFPFTRSVR
ncbi:MAG: PA2779 family protein [Burkholderiaceae bacterium]